MPGGCLFVPDSPVVQDRVGVFIHLTHIAVAHTQPGSATEQAWELVDEWYNETGDENRVFGQENPLTQEIIHDDQMKQFRQEWANSGYQLPFTFKPTIDDRGEGSSFIRGVGVMFREHIWELGGATLGFGSGDLDDNIDPVGGTIGSLDRVTVTDAGNGQVRYHVYNEMGFASLTRIPTTNNSVLPNRDRSEPGPGGTTTQIFYWYEPIPLAKWVR